MPLWEAFQIGKSHLAKAIGHAAFRKYMTVMFFDFHELLNYLFESDLNNKLDNALRHLMKTDLLIIDDFAFKKMDQKYAEYYYAVIAQRYGLKSTLIKSNRWISDWITIFPDPIMAHALMDWFCHNAYQIIIKGESYRNNMLPNS